MDTIREAYPYYLAGRAITSNTDLEVTNKYTGEVATRVALADHKAIDQAIEAAVKAQKQLQLWPTYKRKAVLKHLVDQMRERQEELAIAICVEAGKPIKDARGEVARSIDTCTIAMEESTRLYGEVMPLDITERAAGYEGVWKRVPHGPCSFITPFNFPLNLAMHKVAPAIAAGSAFVLKPAPRTPISAILLGEMLAESELPEGAFSVLPVRNEDASPFVEDERLTLLSFTGSVKVGWELKSNAGRKKVALELGGNAACIVDRDADIELAAERLVFGAFYQSGQSCISVQRILAHRDIYDGLRSELHARIAKLTMGDPLDEDTFVGPLISEDDARRIEQWVDEAVERGGTVLTGGQRNGVFYEPTIVEDVPTDVALSCQEAFGPVATLESFDDFDLALQRVNDSEFGLQAGVFTNSLEHAYRAFDHLVVGGVVINDVPSFRVDNMPYGGVKQSGLGREGIRFAMEDMTEIRLMILNRSGGNRSKP